MAALGAEVTGSWVLSSGVVSFFIVLVLLSIFLTALCSECSRRSFELREPETGKDPSALIRVVKLEEVARENPMIGEIQKDEKEFSRSEAHSASVSPWRSHQEAPQDLRDVQTNGSAAVMKPAGDAEAAESCPEEDYSVPFTPWRSHLGAPQSLQDADSSAPVDHIYHTVGRGDAAPPTNQEPEEARSASVYARVSRKTRPATPPQRSPERQVEGEESTPPLPGRTQ